MMDTVPDEEPRPVLLGTKAPTTDEEREAQLTQMVTKTNANLEMAQENFLNINRTLDMYMVAVDDEIRDAREGEKIRARVLNSRIAVETSLRDRRCLEQELSHWAENAIKRTGENTDTLLSDRLVEIMRPEEDESLPTKCVEMLTMVRRSIEYLQKYGRRMLTIAEQMATKDIHLDDYKDQMDSELRKMRQVLEESKVENVQRVLAEKNAELRHTRAKEEKERRRFRDELTDVQGQLDASEGVIVALKRENTELRAVAAKETKFANIANAKVATMRDFIADHVKESEEKQIILKSSLENALRQIDLISRQVVKFDAATDSSDVVKRRSVGIQMSPGEFDAPTEETWRKRLMEDVKDVDAYHGWHFNIYSIASMLKAQVSQRRAQRARYCMLRLAFSCYRYNVRKKLFFSESQLRTLRLETDVRNQGYEAKLREMAAHLKEARLAAGGSSAEEAFRVEHPPDSSDARLASTMLESVRTITDSLFESRVSTLVEALGKILKDVTTLRSTMRSAQRVLAEKVEAGGTAAEVRRKERAQRQHGFDVVGDGVLRMTQVFVALKECFVQLESQDPLTVGPLLDTVGEQLTVSSTSAMEQEGLVFAENTPTPSCSTPSVAGTVDNERAMSAVGTERCASEGSAQDGRGETTVRGTAVFVDKAVDTMDLYGLYGGSPAAQSLHHRASDAKKAAPRAAAAEYDDVNRTLLKKQVDAAMRSTVQRVRNSLISAGASGPSNRRRSSVGSVNPFEFSSRRGSDYTLDPVGPIGPYHAARNEEALEHQRWIRRTQQAQAPEGIIARGEELLKATERKRQAYMQMRATNYALLLSQVPTAVAGAETPNYRVREASGAVVEISPFAVAKHFPLLPHQNAFETIRHARLKSNANRPASVSPSDIMPVRINPIADEPAKDSRLHGVWEHLSQVQQAVASEMGESIRSYTDVVEARRRAEALMTDEDKTRPVWREMERVRYERQLVEKFGPSRPQASPRKRSSVRNDVTVPDPEDGGPSDPAPEGGKPFFRPRPHTARAAIMRAPTSQMLSVSMGFQRLHHESAAKKRSTATSTGLLSQGPDTSVPLTARGRQAAKERPIAAAPTESPRNGHRQKSPSLALSFVPNRRGLQTSIPRPPPRE